MGSDKKRKHSKEDKEVDAGISSKHDILTEHNGDPPSKKQKKDRKDKKESKEKKDKKESKEKKEKKEKKESKDKKEKKDKKESKDKKEQAEKKESKGKKEKNEFKVKEKKEKKDKEDKKASKDDAKNTKGEIKATASSSELSSAPSLDDLALLSMDMDVDDTPLIAKAAPKDKAPKQEVTKEKKVVEIKASGSNSASGSGAENTPKVDENGLTRMERQKLKKEAFLAKKAQNKEPSLTIKEPHGTIQLTNLRDLVVHVLTETPAMSWLEVKNKASIEKVVMVYIAGLDPQLFHINLKNAEHVQHPFAWIEKATSGPVTEFERLKQHFDKVNVVKATGDQQRIHSPTNTLLSVPLSNSEKQKRDLERLKNKNAKLKKPEDYMLKLQELKENSFPLPTYIDASAPPLEPGWIETPKIAKTTLAPLPKTMIAMDCEMCRTEAGPELTRVTLIDSNGKTILDELVMPENPILDYLTQYSGMTAVRLEGVTTRLADVQKKVQQLVNYHTILVGHSLENDMAVLKLAHPFIIDTSITYHHTRGPPYRPGLKWLSQKWLNRQIQVNSARGHDSAEDALSCMDLMKLKLTKPAGFGEYSPDNESLFSRLSRFMKPRTSALIDADAFAGLNAQTTIRTQTDAEVVAAVPEAVKNHNFVWARLRDLEINHGKAPPLELEEGQLVDTGRASKISSADKVQATTTEIREGVRSIDESIAAIIDSVPARTAVIVTSGQGDHRDVSKMQNKQRDFLALRKALALGEIPIKDRFLEKDVKLLEDTVEEAKHGVFFLMVKQ
ncbi:MAG: hypothetical protein BYD32DRAFT_440346 [Podila humilis]|nr:MAG: hypothetical protein BYD32DRAFT_440346 [Podila humilis]